MLYKLFTNFYAKYLFSIAATVVGYLALLLNDGIRFHDHILSCPFKYITGIPCPGCGMGRATYSIFHGNILNSFSYNLLSLPFNLAVAVSLVWMLADLIMHRETFFSFIKKDVKTPYKIILFLIIGLSWGINIYRKI